MDVNELTADPQVLLTELGDGTGVLLHLDTKFYYQLNATGLVVWKAISDAMAASGRVSTASIADALAEHFDVDAHAAEDDVRSLVKELVDEGLLVRRGAEKPAAIR